MAKATASLQHSIEAVNTIGSMEESCPRSVRKDVGLRTLASSSAAPMQDNSALICASPTPVNRTLMRKPNADYRPREYLTEGEVERLIEAARKRGRNGSRDAAAILLAYRHGLRAQELCSLK